MISMKKEIHTKKRKQNDLIPIQKIPDLDIN